MQTLSVGQRSIVQWQGTGWLPLLLVIPLVIGALVDSPRGLWAGPITALGALSVAQVLIAALGVLAARIYPRAVLSRLAPYALFFSWMVARSAIEVPDQDGVQNALAYLLFGVQFLLAGTLAANARRATLSMLDRGFLALDVVGLGLVVISYLSSGLPGAPGEDGGWLVGPRGVALLAIVPICWHLAAWCHGRPRAGIRAIAWMLVVITSLSRMATAVALVTAALAFIAQGWVTPGRLARRIPLIGLGLSAVVILVVAFQATLYERFFEGYNTVEVGGVSVSTSGRNLIWPVVIDSGSQHPIVGGGLGSSQAALSEFDPLGVGHPHNDYLRVWHDGGIIGLGLLLVALFRWLFVLWRQWVRTVRRARAHPEIDLAALLTLLGIMLAASTDNCLVYAFVMAPAGLLVGAAIGLRAYEDAPVPPPVFRDARTLP